MADLPLPLSRLAECPKCRAYLHACRMCGFYDARIASRCREERAEDVHDREHANFCEWFKPRPDAHHPADKGKNQTVQSKLDGLFNGTADPLIDTDSARNRLDDLFGSNGKPKK
ncbi:MAG: hypothetical protein ACYDBW_06140 [Sulfuricaulis sp.]